jgi:hypothetical protein
MSDATVNPEDVAARARALIEADVSARVEAVRVVADAANEAEAAEARAREASTAHEKAWKAAIDAGWTEKDLRATGARAPGQSGTRRRRSSSSGSAPAAQPQSGE